MARESFFLALKSDSLDRFEQVERSKITWCPHGGISKKNLVAFLHMYDKPQILSIFHFDWVSDGGMAHVLGVRQTWTFRKEALYYLHTYILAES